MAYEYQEYPKWMYPPDGGEGSIVQNPEQERLKAEQGWVSNPALLREPSEPLPVAEPVPESAPKAPPTPKPPKRKK